MYKNNFLLNIELYRKQQSTALPIHFSHFLAVKQMHLGQDPSTTHRSQTCSVRKICLQKISNVLDSKNAPLLFNTTYFYRKANRKSVCLRSQYRRSDNSTMQSRWVPQKDTNVMTLCWCFVDSTRWRSNNLFLCKLCMTSEIPWGIYVAAK